MSSLISGGSAVKPVLRDSLTMTPNRLGLNFDHYQKWRIQQEGHSGGEYEAYQDYDERRRKVNARNPTRVICMGRFDVSIGHVY